MIYENLKKYQFNFDFNFMPSRQGFTHTSLVKSDFWIFMTYKEFKHNHYKKLFDEIFDGLFLKFVYKLADGNDYRINVHCDGIKSRYLVAYIEHQVLAVYDFRTPDKIIIKGTECSFDKQNDAIFNFQLQYPFIMNDITEIISEIQKKHP